MISRDLLERTATALAAYRGDGRGMVLFDSRDRGNYGNSYWDFTFSMLMRNDPTGLAAGMLLNEMIEATIAGSKVMLSRVLREAGFLDRLGEVLRIKSELYPEIEGPMSRLIEHVDAALAQTGSTSGGASTREVSLCLRDAIHSIDSSMSLRWLLCEEIVVADQGQRTAAHSTLALNIGHYADTAAFADGLRHSLPWGAHLARIGYRSTAIGIKQPGRIAFLSTLKLSQNHGGVDEARSGSNLAEHLDLDNMVEHYPEWTGKARYDGDRHVPAAVGQVEDHKLTNLSMLPRDVVIWTAMLTEITSQRMACAKPGEVELAESLGIAIGMGADAGAATRQKRLPAVVAPNWSIEELTFEAGLRDLMLGEWERSFLAPATDGMHAGLFLPVGQEDLALNLETRESCPYPRELFDSGREFGERHVKLFAIDPSWVGTRAETEAARKAVFLRNLAEYLIAWGNIRFNDLVDVSKPWVGECIARAMPASLEADFVSFNSTNLGSGLHLHFYKQAPKRVTYKPHCIVNAKYPATHMATFKPRCSADLLVMLGLGKDEDLPEFLRGWTMDASWTTTDTHGDTKTHHPMGMMCRWDFSRTRSGSRHAMEATVCVSQRSLPGLNLDDRGQRAVSPRRSMLT